MEDQDRPLLPENFKSIDSESNTLDKTNGKNDDKNSASFTTTVLNLCNNIVGAGILSLPHAFMDASIIGATILLTVTCLLSATSMILLAFCCKTTKTLHFHDLAKKLVGSKFSLVLQGCLCVYTYLSCIAFLILIGDFLSGETGLLPSICSTGCRDTMLFEFLSHRPTVILCVSLGILFPLCLKRNLSSLRNTSFLSFISMIYLTGFIFYHFMGNSVVRNNIRVFNLSSKFFRAAPIVNVAYICHYNAPKYYEEFHSRSIFSFSTAVFTAFMLCSTIYFLVGLFGYLLFGNAVLGDIMINFKENSLDVIAAKFSLTLTVMFTYPLAFNAFRSAAFTVIESCSVKFQGSLYFAFTTFLLIVTTLIPGLLLKDIAIVLDYKGSTLGGFIGFGLTGLFLYNLNMRHADSVKYPRLAITISCIFIAWCGITSILGVYVTTKSIHNI